MMSIGISMVVKNEAQRIGACFAEIVGEADAVVVVDTGSTDDTIGVLKREFGISAIKTDPYPADPDVITHARNFSLQHNTCDWVLVLDADEKLTASDFRRLKALTADSRDDAYFLTWRNARGGQLFDDYKLALFRNGLGIRFEGLVHCNAQGSVRRLGLEARLLPEIVIEHSLDERGLFRSRRKDRLARYAAEDPQWWRYQWFLGYTYFKENDFELAVPLLRDTCNSLSEDFPVECLNAHIVLTDLNARKGIHDKCFRIMRQAAAFYETVKDDFEVKANRQMSDWIAEAVDLINQNKLEAVRSYEFAY
jgi:glycosyltransferase involved in cell wall biosynthesis